MNKWDEMRAAVQDANSTLRAADSVSLDMAIMLVGRLRRASRTWRGEEALVSLKRELRDFNMKTRSWK